MVPRGRGRRPLPRRAFRGVLFVFLSFFFYGAPGAASCPAGRPSPDPSAGPRGAPAHAAPPRWEPPACRPTGPRASRATCVADRELTSEPTRGPPTREVPPRRHRRAENAGRHVVADRDGRDPDRADDGRRRGPAQARRGHDARRRLRARVIGRDDGRRDPGGYWGGGQGLIGAEAAVAVDGADVFCGVLCSLLVLASSCSRRRGFSSRRRVMAYFYTGAGATTSGSFSRRPLFACSLALSNPRATRRCARGGTRPSRPSRPPLLDLPFHPRSLRLG